MEKHEQLYNAIKQLVIWWHRYYADPAIPGTLREAVEDAVKKYEENYGRNKSS